MNFMLSFSVRLCENRLNLIKNALSANPKNYLKYEKLLKLGSLIQIPAKDNLNQVGQILAVIAESAIQESDFDFAHKMCQNLMNDSHSGAWQICWRLAECDGFSNLSDRRRLIAFALTHCTADVIEKLLTVKSHIEIQELYYRINQDTELSNVSGRNLQSNVFKTLSNKFRLQDNVMKWVSNPFGVEEQAKVQNSQAKDSSNVTNKSLNNIFCNEFYVSIYENTSISDGAILDQSITNSDPSVTDRFILRMEKLFESNQLGKDYDQASEIFFSLANNHTKNDTALMLSYLLAVPERKTADKFFKKSNSALNFKLAIYYYSLQIYLITQKAEDSIHKRIISSNPNEILKIATDSVQTTIFNDGDNDCQSTIEELWKLLQYYQTALTDYVQAQTLRSLGRGVDTARFAVDNEYKYDTILGLSMTLRDSVFKTAISLAERYSISHWDIYMTHTEWLLTDSGLAVSALEDRIASLNVLDFLITDIENARHRLENNVYPAIQGTDYGMLTFYFQLLNTLTDDNTPVKVNILLKGYRIQLLAILIIYTNVQF